MLPASIFHGIFVASLSRAWRRTPFIFLFSIHLVLKKLFTYCSFSSLDNVASLRGAKKIITIPATNILSLRDNSSSMLSLQINKKLFPILSSPPTGGDRGFYFFNNNTTAAVITILTNASGINFFHPRFIN